MHLSDFQIACAAFGVAVILLIQLVRAGLRIMELEKAIYRHRAATHHLPNDFELYRRVFGVEPPNEYVLRTFPSRETFMAACGRNFDDIKYGWERRIEEEKNAAKASRS